MNRKQYEFYRWICELLRVNPDDPETLTPPEALRRLADYVENLYIDSTLPIKAHNRKSLNNEIVGRCNALLNRMDKRVSAKFTRKRRPASKSPLVAYCESIIKNLPIPDDDDDEKDIVLKFV